VLLGVARDIGEQIVYTRLDTGRTGPTNRRALEVLEKARVVHRIRTADPSGPPLAASARCRRFKAALLDIGLLQRLSGVPPDVELRSEDLLAMYRGKLAEQFVAQELVASCSPSLHYWTRDARGSSAEVDFLVVRRGRVTPVEVKSGAGGSLRSLRLFLDSRPDCREGIVLRSGPFSRHTADRLTFLPLYAAASIADPLPDSP
jgi:hypothetical protein